jgi:hypothetical protein
MHLKLMNVSNDLTDAKVTMALSPGVKWKNVFSPENADVSYNERSNELVWNIGTMPAGIGILTDPRELVFQIGIVPNQNQVGKFVNLLGKSVFSAEDVFTKQKLESILEGKDSNLLEDMSVGNQGQVAQ